MSLTIFRGGVQLATAELRRNSQSHFEIYGPNGRYFRRRGVLPMTPERFDAVAKAVQPYRAQAKALSTLIDNDVENVGCSPGDPYSTVQGGMHIVWETRQETYIKSVFFDCDPKRNAAEFNRLKRVFETLHLPKPRTAGLIDR